MRKYFDETDIRFFKILVATAVIGTGLAAYLL